MTSSPRLLGLTAIVSGASSGIGYAVTQRLRSGGATVAAVARRRVPIDETTHLAGRAGSVLPIKADVTSAADIERIVETVLSHTGRIDIVVNNAGLMLLGPGRSIPFSDWFSMVQVNLVGTMALTHACLPHLVKSATSSPHGAADIVNISSTAGRVARTNSAGYAASKHAVVAFTESLRQELATDHVRVCVIEPGATQTELISHNRPEMRNMLEQSATNLDLLKPGDVADAVEYVVTRPARVAINEMLLRPWNQVS